MRARGPILATALALAACDPEIPGERGDWTLGFPDLAYHPLGWPAPHLVVAGTRLCPVLSCKTCPEGQDCSAAPIAADGPLTADGDGCWLTDTPGDVVWTVGAPCIAPGLEPDRAGMRVVALADVTPRVRSDDDVAVDFYVANGLATATGAAFRPDPPSPLRVLAGAQVAFFVELVESATGDAVARDRGAVTWTTDAGRPPVTYPGDRVELVTFPGTAATPSFELDDRTWPLGPVLGVDRSEAATLELAAATNDGGPALARAIVRDAAGQPLYGAAVTWSVDKHALALGARNPNPDYVDLADACRPPEDRGGARKATVRARWRDLEAALTLRWTGTPGDPDPSWQPDETCDAGCGCRTADPTGALLAPPLLLLRRRRRPTRHLSLGPPSPPSSHLSLGPPSHRSDNLSLGPPSRDSAHLSLGPPSPPPSHLSLGPPALLALALLLPACGDPPALAPAATRELGALAWDPRISGRDGGYSARVGDRVLFVFGDTSAEKAPDALPGFLNNTACTTPDLDASDGLFPLDEHLEERGYPHEFLPLTDAELAHEAAHNGPDCGDACEGVALWPGPVIPDPARGRVLVFYAKLLQRPGPLDVTVVGTSIAVWDEDLPTHATRPLVAPDSDEPTLLFPAGDLEMAAAALVDGDDLLAYACEGRGFDKPCRLARAPLADPLTRGAWRFLARDGAWSTDASDAVELFQGAPMMTVHHKPEHDLYVAVYAEPGGTRILLRTAPAPEGPWSDPADLHHPRKPLAESSMYGALMHPELARDGGATDYLTYYLGDTGTIQLVEISWPR